MKIDKALEEINNASLVKIIFYTGQLQIPNLDFYNIIFAANGVFVSLKSDFGVTIGKLNAVKYSNPQLKELDDSLIYSFVPKPPLSLFTEILEMFKYVNQKMDAELCVNVYYHKENKTFHLNIVEQVVSMASADYKYDEKFEMSNEYIRYLQIHSHNTMGASFSPKDDRDENFTAPCYFGVVGKISNTSQFYSVESKFRIWDGTKFVEIDFGDIFNIGFNRIKLQEETLERLDVVIEASKKAAKEKYRYPFSAAGQFPLVELVDDDDPDEEWLKHIRNM